MTDKQLEVLCNIIAAVESGGQVYGKGDWSNVTMPYTNTKNEHTVTLGAYQLGGGSNEGRDLLRLIRDTYPDVWRKYAAPPADHVDKGLDLDIDWVSEHYCPTKAWIEAIRQIIGTPEGIAAQKAFFRDTMAKRYIECAEEFGVFEARAQIMWAELQHLGGKNAAVRVFTRAQGNYSMYHILACLVPKYADLEKYTAPVEHQMFWTRHCKVIEFIENYLPSESEDNMKYTPDAVIAEAEKWIGYLEKASSGTDSELQSKTWNPGSNNITWFWRWHDRHGTLSGLQGGAWCDGFVDFIHGVVAGVEKASKSLGGFSGYTPDSAQRFKVAGRWIPRNGDVRRGDQIFFRGYVSTEGQTRICHTGIVEKVTATKVYTIEGNTSSEPGVVANGGCVRRKSYDRNYEKIAGYGRPLYDTEEEWRPTGTATASAEATIREEARSDSLAVRKVNAGDRFEVDGKTSGAWTHVNVAGAVGWIATKFVKPDAPTKPEAKPEAKPAEHKLHEEAQRTGTVTTLLNVRKFAGKEYALCTFSPLAKGTEVGICDELHAKNGDLWYYILVNGKHGFVNATYIK